MSITNKPTLKLIKELPAAIGAINAVAISPDLNWIASAGSRAKNNYKSQQYSWSLNLYDLSLKSKQKFNLAENNDWQPHDSDILSISFSPDSTKLLVGSSMYQSKSGINISSWNIDRNPIDFIANSTTDRHFISDAIFHPDGKTFFVSGISHGNAMIQQYSISNLELIKQWMSKNEQMTTDNDIRAFAISMDGKHIYAAGVKGIQCWDTNVEWGKSILFPVAKLCVGKELIDFGRHDEIRSLALSSDDRILASGSQQRIKIWNAQTGELLQSFYAHADWVWDLAVTPNARFLISAGDTTIKFWDLVPGKKVNTINAHESQIRSISLSHDGKMLVSGATDGIVKVWEVQNTI
jgi:WD40 repeat protein